MRSRGWIGYPLPGRVMARTGQQEVAEGGDRPELADVGRLARRLVRQVVHIARAEEASVRRLLADHLGGQAGTLPVASGSWPRYDHVNVQAGLDAWLAEPGREHEVAGLTGFHHRVFGLADLIQPGSWQPGLGLCSVTTDSLPAGPGGVTLACVQCALYLVTEPEGPIVLLVRGPGEHNPVQGVIVEAVAAGAGRAQRAIDDIRRLSIARNVFRGHVIEFGGEVFEHDGGALLSFRTRPQVAREQVELLRRAALSAADESADEVPGKPITVTDAHMAIALDQLLDTRNQLTRVLLGGQPRSGAGQVLHEGGGDLAGLGDVGEVRTAADHPEPGTADG